MNDKKEITKYRVAYAAVVAVISIVVVSVLLLLKSPAKDPGLTPEPTPSVGACTMEARICPDGSSVGRVGPNCEFQACPEVPEGITLLLKGQTIQSEDSEGIGQLVRGAATSDVKLKSLFQKFLGKLEAPNCYTTVTGEHCVSDADLGGLQIDWRKSFVVGTSLGERATGGYEITITGYEQVGNMIYVFVQETTPGKGCFAIEMLTNPYVIASLDIPSDVATQKTVVYKVSTIAGPACQE